MVGVAFADVSPFAILPRMDSTLSIIASILTIVGCVIGLLGSAREREGLRMPEDPHDERTDLNVKALTNVGLWALTFRAVSAVAVILAAAAYLFARALYENDYSNDSVAAAGVFTGWAAFFGVVGMIAGGLAFALPVRVLQRAHGWLFATFTVTMGGILVMFAYALSATH